jgi:hypothetical protein
MVEIVNIVNLPVQVIHPHNPGESQERRDEGNKKGWPS